MADDEDDYLTMTFAEPVTTKSASKESSLQRTQRLKREAAERARPLSKAELAAKQEAQREAALSTKLDNSNKGAMLMAKMGFKGGALGAANNQGRENPIEISLKDGRGGIGVESEKKRKLREAAEAAGTSAKRAKIDESDYRERNKQEREEKRAEGQWWGAMKVLEDLHEGKEATAEEEDVEGSKNVKLLYTPLVKDRKKKEDERRRAKLLQDGLPRHHDYGEDSDEEETTAIAYDQELEEQEDTEVDEYEELPSVERLAKVLDTLRAQFHYCFWCMYRYSDEQMEGCPGPTEDGHG